ncbi:MAG: DUF4136 domain-containing protein [Gammaproteobacteria bacterium]|nr:DUF4136 domain-containing protein [Gammaproteobacteria bacterium]
MNMLQRYLLLVPVALVCACSGIKVEQDYAEKTDFSKLKSYAWQSDKQKSTGDVRVDNSLLNNRIRQAVDNSLSSKGFNKSATKKTDFLVAYHYVIREKDEDSRVHTGIGIGAGHRGSYGGLMLGLGGSDRDYEVGELTIDILDPNNQQIIWRGVASRKIISQSDPAERAARINETIAAVLKKFPPR